MGTCCYDSLPPATSSKYSKINKAYAKILGSFFTIFGLFPYNAGTRCHQQSQLPDHLPPTRHTVQHQHTAWINQTVHERKSPCKGATHYQNQSTILLLISLYISFYREVFPVVQLYTISMMLPSESGFKVIKKK